MIIRRFDILLSDFGVLNSSCDEDATSDRGEAIAGAASGKRTLPEKGTQDDDT